MKDTPTPRTNKCLTFDSIALCETLERELTAVTEQRDRMAEALYRIANNNVQDTSQTDYAYELGRMEGIAKIALKSLKPTEP